MKTGIYPDLSPEDYYRDPCEVASLTQSLCKVLLDRSPIHAWIKSPKLNGDWKPDEKEYDRASAIGLAAHSYLLGRGRKVMTADYDSWRTADARKFRDSAWEDGHIPILREHDDVAQHMADIVRNSGVLIGPGNYECTVIAAESDGRAWCRALIDFLSADRTDVIDYKTTSMSCAPHVI